MSRRPRRSLARNMAINVLGQLLPVCIPLLVIPPYLHAVGEVRYGVLAILWILLAYFAAFDFGLGRATAHQLAQLQEAPSRDVAGVFWTTLVLNTVLGLVGGAVLYAFGRIMFVAVFKVPAPLLPEALGALPYLAIAVPVTTVSGTLLNTLVGWECFGVLNVLAVLDMTLFQLAPLAVAVWRGPALPGLVAAAVGCRALINLGLALVACWQLVPSVRRPRIDRARVRELFSFGGWISATGLIYPLLSCMDRMLLGAQAGAQAVAAYALPMSLVGRIQTLPVGIAQALFPRFTALAGEEARPLAKEALLGLAAMLTPLMALGIVAMPLFMRVWVHSAMAATAAPIGEILLVGMWANCLVLVPNTLLQSLNRPDMQAKLYAAEFLPFVGLLALAIAWDGARGAAIAWALRAIVDAWLTFRLARMAWRDLAALGPQFGLLVVACLATLGGDAGWRSAVFACGVLLGACALAWRGAPGAVRQAVGRMPGVRRWVRRLA